MSNEYNGSIELISGLKQANGQDFPLMEAHAIQVGSNGTRLDEVLDASYGKPNKQDFGLVWMRWTNNLDTGRGIENDAISYAKHDIVMTQRLDLNKLADSRPMFTQNSIKILDRAKQLNSKLRQFEYIQSDSGRIDFEYNGDHAHLNSDGTWEGSTADLSNCTKIYTFEQFCDWFDFFKETGADGVFFDDWGYDFAKEDICAQFGWNVDDIVDLNDAKNRKWTALIDACHERGLSVVTNGGTPFSVGDWYTHLDENDIICLESCMVSSAGKGTWNEGHNNIYNYYSNWYSNGKCKAKLWALAYTPGGSQDLNNKILTYVCAFGLACGVQYISVGVGQFLEKPSFVDVFVTGDNKTITKIDNNTYHLKVGQHQLEAHRWSGLNGVVTDRNISKNYYLLDGRPFNNAFTDAPVAEYELSEKVETMEKTVEGMTEDTRKNASSYWRISIDDWQPDLSYVDYKNLMFESDFKFSSSYWNQAQLEVIKNDDGSLDLAVHYTDCDNANIRFEVINSSNYEDLKLTTEGLEFGFSDVIWDMKEGSWALPNGTAYYGSSVWGVPSFRPYFGYTVDGQETYVDWIKGVDSDLGETGGHYERTKSGSISALWVYIWARCPGKSQLLNGTVTFKNVYLIDRGEHSDEITKKWYTNIFPTNFNVRSAIDVTEEPAKKLTRSVYNIVAKSWDPWGWAVYRFAGDEVVNLRGHTIELGCSSMVLSNGLTGSPASGGSNYAFGIGINKDDPNSYRLYSNTVKESGVWGEELICLTCTIPEDATSVCVGFKSFGYPNGLTVTLKDVYMYDLSEEVAIRGQVTTNSSLKLCRVSEEQENMTPSKIRNSLYITDKGRMYSYDLRGNKVDIAGSIYAGAVEAGYAGSPSDFGASLYSLISQKE